MAIVTLNNAGWTQVALGATEFLAQNRAGHGNTFAYGADPGAGVTTGFWVKPNWTLTNVGTDNLWGRGSGDVEVHQTA